MLLKLSSEDLYECRGCRCKGFFKPFKCSCGRELCGSCFGVVVENNDRGSRIKCLNVDCGKYYTVKEVSGFC